MEKIHLSVNGHVLLEHFKKYFAQSLQHFPSLYVKNFMPDVKDGDKLPNHLFYLCPLCASNFIMVLKTEQADGTFEESVKLTSDFSLDHYPPESAGGKNKVLVCKTCNNTAGHAYDLEVKKHIQHVSLGKEGVSTKVDIKHNIEGVGYFSGMLESNEKNEWVFHMKKQEKDKIKPVDEWIADSNKKDFTITITMPTPKDEPFQKAMLKTAYLYCFSHFGYEFVFSRAGNLIRKVLKGEAEYPIKVAPLQFERHNQKHFDNITIGVCYISQPQNLRSFVVNIKLKYIENGYEAIHSVFIPDPTEMGVEDLKRIPLAIQAQEHTDIEITSLNNILHSTPLAYSQTWLQMKDLVKKNEGVLTPQSSKRTTTCTPGLLSAP